MVRDRCGRAVRRLHAATDVAGDHHFYRRLQARRSDGWRDGDAAVHLARLLAQRNRGGLEAGWILRDGYRRDCRWPGDVKAWRDARAYPVRASPVSRQLVLRPASGG